MLNTEESRQAGKARNPVGKLGGDVWLACCYWPKMSGSQLSLGSSLRYERQAGKLG